MTSQVLEGRQKHTQSIRQSSPENANVILSMPRVKLTRFTGEIICLTVGGTSVNIDAQDARRVANAILGREQSSGEVRASAVEQFLSNIDTNTPLAEQFAKLGRDAKSYNWNDATVQEIGAQVTEAYNAAK